VCFAQGDELASHTNKQEALTIPQALTVEHVLPQAWEKSGSYPIPDMTDAQRIDRNRILHTFGNLTLLTQALNSSASNGPFHTKVDPDTGVETEGKRRKISANSLLKMNSYFQGLAKTEWDESAVTARAEKILSQALKVWARPE